VLWALVAVMTGLYVWGHNTAQHANVRFQINEVYGDAPAFRLTDQQGRAFSSEELAGKVWMANFIYTRCGDECPRMSGVLANVANVLEKERLLGTHVHLVTITVDPDYDTPERLAAYSSLFGGDPRWWHFLTGERAYIEQILTQGFHVTMINRTVASLLGGVAHAHGTDDAGIEIIHSERIVVVDRDGVIRKYIDGLQTPPDEIVAQVKAYL